MASPPQQQRKFPCTLEVKHEKFVEKTEGVLEVGDYGVSFRSIGAGDDDAGAFLWRALAPEVRSVRVAKKTPRVRIEAEGETVPSGMGEVVFLFPSPEVRDDFACALSKRRKGTVDVNEIAGTLPALGTAEHAKASVLTANPALQKLHRELTEKGSLTDEDFWSLPARQMMLDEFILSQQPLGMRSAHFLRELQMEKTTTPDGEVYRLNRQIISDIFREHPVVREAFEEHVVRRGVSEARFWRDFLASPFLGNRERRGAQRDARENIFDAILAQQREKERLEGIQQEQEQQQPDTTTAASPADPTPHHHHSLLESPGPTDAPGYGTRRPAEWVGMDANMGVLDTRTTDEAGEVSARYNRHSSKVLKGLPQVGGGSAGGAAAATLALDDATQEACGGVGGADAPPAKRQRAEDGGSAALPLTMPHRTVLPAVPLSAVRQVKRGNVTRKRAAGAGWAEAAQRDAVRLEAWVAELDARRAPSAMQDAELSARLQAEQDLDFTRQQVMDVLTLYWHRTGSGTPAPQKCVDSLHTFHDQLTCLHQALPTAADKAACTSLKSLVAKAVADHEKRSGAQQGWVVA